MKAFLERTIASGKPWTDPEFPPDKSSLYDAKIDIDADPSAFNGLSWKRASAIYNPLYIFEDGVEPNDIN